MFTLQTFGCACLIDDHKRVIVSEQRLRVALLALLAVAGERGLSRDKLIGYLWPESSTEKARHSLHQLLYYLRRDVHPDLFLGADPLRLNPELVTSDVAQFASALAAGSWELAAPVYTGPFLDGFFISEAEEFEKWVESQRARWQAEYANALRNLAQEADARGLHAVAIEHWRTFSALEPLNARAALGFMRALVAAGDPSQALQHAHRHETVVREETGQPCSAEVLAYVQELKSAGGERTGRLFDALQGNHDGIEERAPVRASQASASSSRQRLPQLKVPAISLAAALVLLAGAGGYSAFRSSELNPRAPTALDTAAAPAIAILPFGVSEPALQTWTKGALVLLATDLDGVAGLRAIDPQSILAYLHANADSATLRSSGPDRRLALDAARRTGARYAVRGNVVAFGSSVRISADVLETANARLLQQVQVEGKSDRIFALLDELAIDVLRIALRREGQHTDVSHIDLARGGTTSMPALKAYLLGEELYQQSRFKEAADAYEHALKADSSFTLMFSRFLVPYSYVEEATPKTLRDPLAHALRMLDHLPPRDALLVRADQELRRDNIPAAYALLRQASRAYPDDYEVWYSLGEVALHEADGLLLPPDDALQAFSHSVELNPSFGPPYAHLIELTLGERGDSARAAQLNAAYARIAPDADNLSWGRLSLALAFGEAEARARALAVLDTMPVPVVAQLAKYLNQPRFRAAQEQVHEIISKRRSEPNSYPHPFAANAYIARGKLSAAVANALQHDACPLATIYWSYLLGSRISDEAEAALRHKTPRSDSCESRSFVFRAAYAIDRGWWPDADREQAGLNAAMTQELAAGDSLNARQLRLVSEALRGYRIARAGDPAAGIHVLQSVQPELRMISEPVRWWLGTLLLQSGRAAEARPYFASFWVSKSWTPASYYLGQIDENLDRRAEARAEYERFANGWRDADSDVQPRVADARAASSGLARAGLGH